jgi:hypothetical protein
MKNTKLRKTLVAVVIITSVMITLVLSQETFIEYKSAEETVPITVYKSPTCKCCNKWVQHLEDNGFNVNTVNKNDMKSIKSEEGVPRQLASCHTAVVGNYVIEGHVPAIDIKRLLKEKPAIAGLTVPGMPMGSPGMEGARKDPYNVLTFTKDGDSTVFSQY